ncbi:bifunctional diguanylate cyclase/phosphodiesterase [Alteromonas sp. NFXS44]|uniref:putative bifunctional diguanylate cyclase/phosphodiesterase n=1 Tax=Alteromonas sp. NFXS44 TaxID=2818435 RepID=UPI0032DF799C
MDIFHLNALGITDCALFELNERDELNCLTPTVHWVTDLVKVNELSLDIESVRSLFLEDFLIDACDCWATSLPANLTSGFWTETTEHESLRLEAIAINDGKGGRFLAIKNVNKEFAYRQQSLQSARELLLTHHAVISQQDYLTEKLQKALKEARECKGQQQAIRQTIHHLSTGVVILDANKQLFLDNGVARQFFRAQNADVCVHRLLQLIKDVQLDEMFLSTLEERQTAWRGEVFWMNSPDGGRWLQLTIAPVMQHIHVSHWVFLLTDMSHIQHTSQYSPVQLDKDSLTQTLSRQALKKEMTAWVEKDENFGLFVIDICEFRKVNESLGYRSGDDILKSVAKRLHGFVGEEGRLARIGGNEFAVMTPVSAGNETALYDIARGITGVLEHTYLSLGSIQTTLSTNIGMATFPEHAKSPEGLMQNAGYALQFAKYAGKNKVTLFHPMHKQKQVELAEMEAAFARAIVEDTLDIYLQPIVDLSSGKLLKYEALARWKRNDEYVPPDVFISLAERSELIFPFGEWLLDKVCSTARRMIRYVPDVRIAMNISGRQIISQDFTGNIQAAIKRHGISASNLAIEITETSFINNLNTVAAVLKTLRNMGVTISIDDFGTGFSSLVYLKQLPLDELKIDRSFIRDAMTSEGDRAIIKAILGLAGNLNLQVVAEGVETGEQQHFLLDEQCVSGQGYLFDHPLPVEEIEKRFAAG